MRRLLVAACGLPLLAGCTDNGPAAPAAHPSSASQSPGGPTAPGPTALGGTPGGQGTQSPPPRRADCVASTEEATVRPNEEVGQVCLLVGARLNVTSAPSPDQPWQPLVSSDDSVLRCASTAGTGGTINGSCAALRAGSVVVTSQSKAPAGTGDRWRLSLVVVA